MKYTPRIQKNKAAAATNDNRQTPITTPYNQKGSCYMEIIHETKKAFNQSEAGKGGDSMENNQLKFEIVDGSIDITEESFDEFINKNINYDPFVPNKIWSDPDLFTDEAKTAFINLSQGERPQFIIELLENFFRKNPEYANFARITIYKDPLQLLEFFQGIKHSHFKKCANYNISNIDLRFKELQKQIKYAELCIARNPINTDELETIWPILRIRDLFTESELARLYYIQNPRTENAVTEILEDPSAYPLPFGPHLFLMIDAITHAAAKRNFSFEVTKGGRKKSDRTKSLVVVPVKNGFELTQRKKGESATITIINKELIQSASAMKLFVFLLSKAAQQNFNPVIYFSLQELVNNGMYSNITNARAGFKNHIAAVQSLQIGVEMKKGKRNIKQSGRVLFTGYDIDQNGVKVQVNDDFDLETLTSYYAMLPAWAFGISNNSFLILLYASMKARTERKDKVNISLSIIREKLSLPTREEYAEEGKKFKAGQYVKTPIIGAIDGIKTAIEINKDANIKLTEHPAINDQNLDEWLKGYITIELSGDYSEKFNEIKEKQIKIIETNTKRKEAARAMVEAKKEVEKDGV